jgi:hypothetical protein
MQPGPVVKPKIYRQPKPDSSSLSSFLNLFCISTNQLYGHFITRKTAQCQQRFSIEVDTDITRSGDIHQQKVV